ncbi:MAG TPA: ribosome assembly factor SBDS [Candidatus Bathyarchaeia archaeon]|nr:ribosome assembly factor SBDS [Candidatus Bathyarchaeia archaeon]
MSDRYTVARISRDEEHFEILVKPQHALDYRMGKKAPISEILAIDTIFTDANKGTRASDEKLKKAFGTLDALVIAETILTKGQLQLTTDQRRQLTEAKRKQVIAFISRNCVDPKTNMPHPATRIEQAMEKIHYPIDPFKEAEEQAKDIIKLLRPILPIKMENVNVEIRIPTEHAARAYGAIKGYGTLKKDEWRADGSWHGVIEMPAGAYAPLIEKLGEMTRGTAEAKMI